MSWRASLSSSSASRALISASFGMSRCSRRARPIALSTRSRRTRCVADRCRVAGGEDQVYDVEDGADPLGELVRRRHPVRDPGGDDLLLGPGDPRGHRGLLHQERAGHLGRGQTAHQPQRQGDLGVPGQGGVAAGEDEPQTVVVARPSSGPGTDSSGDEQRQRPAQHRLAAQHVAGPVARGGRQPGAGPVRDARPRPGLQRLRVRVLGALLGEVEVAGQMRGGGEHPGPVAAVRLATAATTSALIRRSTTGRISTPLCPAETSCSRAARAITSSRSAASSR